jgi:hypothetical protein
MNRSMTERYRFDADGNLIIKREAVLDDHLDACHALRQNGNETGKFRKGFMHHVASIPPIVAMELLKEGIDIFNLNEDMKKRLFQKLNLEMPKLKTVNARL